MSEKCVETTADPGTAPFVYRNIGPAMQHNYLCALCRENKAVIETWRGWLQPCWECQKKGYRLIKFNWIDRLFKRGNEMSETLINDKDIRETPKLYVEWIDSTAIRGWQHGSSMTDKYAEPSKICSIGYLIKETKDFITISTSVSNNGNMMDPLTIPKCAITKKKKIK